MNRVQILQKSRYLENPKRSYMTLLRCSWCGNDPDYINYHDNEWGEPVHDDHKLFEFLILETFQAGLSWITILKKRDNFRMAFDNFDYKKIAKYDDKKFDSLMRDQGIVRNRLKIRASISNANNFIKIQGEFGSFDNYLWGFNKHQILVNNWQETKDIPAFTELSDTISKDLKKRGFKFVGSTVVYAYLQAIGMVNDHISTCFKRQ